MLPLLGIVVIVAGFLLRFNPLAVTAAAALVTGLAAGLDPLAVVAALGKAFNQNRSITLVYLVLPVIGLLEAHGLQERARALVADLRGATLARLLTVYLLARQVTAALGLTSIAGHPQTVRPLLSPMAIEAAGTDDDGRVPAMAAATDNIGVFFGEDIFIALGSILLMKGVLEGYGIALTPFALSVWAIPTAIAAFVVHAVRLWLFGRRYQ
jgi:uncharacterized membrane protein